MIMNQRTTYRLAIAPQLPQRTTEELILCVCSEKLRVYKKDLFEKYLCHLFQPDKI